MVFIAENGGRVVYLVDIQKLCPITGSQLRAYKVVCTVSFVNIFGCCHYVCQNFNIWVAFVV